MLFQTGWFSGLILAAAWCVLVLLLALSAPKAYRDFRKHGSAAALAGIILASVWSLNATPDGGQLAGMSYHLLAVNLIALMLGVPLAFWVCALLYLPYVWIFGSDWQAYPVNALALFLPALAVNLLSRAWVNRLPANIFIFIFVNGFLASAAGMLLTGGVLVAILDRVRAFPETTLWSTAFPVFFLIAWAEAFLSGITAAIFIALRPQWINTFDDGRYLKPSNKIW